MKRKIKWIRWIASLLVLVLFAPYAIGQQIILDKPFRAGELTLFPDLSDENIYYYLPDKPRLATDDEGNPQFSFLRYVENVRTGATEEAAREGSGGGIVHAVVSLEVTEDQLRVAQRELQRAKSDARIEGPVVYKSGKFGLVSSFKEENGEFTKKVVGLGAAPILDGQKAAVSIQLTKLGSKILWESFKTSTPDISFSFEMEIQGYRLPKRASIEADFDQIYKHKGFNAGIATKYLAAEIKLAYDDLVRNGAIKVTQVGSDDKMEALLATAYNKLTEMMFAPIGGTGNPSLRDLSSVGRGNQGSLMDRATRMLNTQNRPQATQPRTTTTTPPTTTRPATTQPTTPPTTPPAEEIAPADPLQEDEPTRDETPMVDPEAEDEAEAETEDAPTVDPEAEPTTDAPTEGPEAEAEAEINRPAESQPTTQPTTQPATQPTTQPTTQPSRGNTRANRSGGTSSGSSIAILATFEMKEIKQKGKFKIDLNKWTSDVITSRFDENIGNLTKYMDNSKFFRQINLDDPLFKQREIVAFIDGSNASDFNNYINFVTVRMQKKHEKGDLTDDEVRIDRYNFNDNGNYFKMLYGWKGDDNRSKWMEYHYEVMWSFFGDHTVTEDLKPTTFNAINLKPPLQKRVIEVQADPDLLKDAEVRLVTVNLYYLLGGKEYLEQVTLNPARQLLSQTTSLILPEGDYDYEYEVTWRLTKNRSVDSGRMRSSESILFVDELPEGE